VKRVDWRWILVAAILVALTCWAFGPHQFHGFWKTYNESPDVP